MLRRSRRVAEFRFTRPRRQLLCRDCRKPTTRTDTLLSMRAKSTESATTHGVTSTLYRDSRADRRPIAVLSRADRGTFHVDPVGIWRRLRQRRTGKDIAPSRTRRPSMADREAQRGRPDRVDERRKQDIAARDHCTHETGILGGAETVGAEDAVGLVDPKANCLAGIDLVDAWHVRQRRKRKLELIRERRIARLGRRMASTPMTRRKVNRGNNPREARAFSGMSNWSHLLRQRKA